MSVVLEQSAKGVILTDSLLNPVYAVISGHMIRSSIIFPGVGYIEMAFASYHQSDPQAALAAVAFL